MIRFEDVTFSYPNSRRPAIRGLDMTVERGEVLAVLGANGSGKSTLACLCNGLFRPSQGTVRVDDMSTDDPASTWTVRSRVGFVQQDPDDQIVGTVVEEDVAFGPENLGVPRAEIRQRVDEALKSVGLVGMERREPHLLSGGQKQRLAIAGALAMRPSYLVLDEPTAMLDPSGRVAVLELIGRLRAEGTGVVHITHHLDDAMPADRAIVLDGGAVAFSGTPSELFASLDRFEEWGLGLTHVMSLRQALHVAGVDLPLDALTPETIAEALCP